MIKKSGSAWKAIQVEKISRRKFSSRFLNLLQNMSNHIILELLWKKPSYLDLFFLSSDSDLMALKQFLSLSGFIKTKEIPLYYIMTIHKLLMVTLKGKEHHLLNERYFSSVLSLKQVNDSSDYHVKTQSLFKAFTDLKSSDFMNFSDAMNATCETIPELLIYQLCFKIDKKKMRQNEKTLKSSRISRINDLHGLQKEKNLFYWDIFRCSLNIVIVDKDKNLVNEITRQIKSLGVSYGLTMKDYMNALDSLFYSRKIKKILMLGERPTLGMNELQLMSLISPPNPQYLISYDFITEDLNYTLPKIPNEFFEGDIFIGKQLSEYLEKKRSLYLSWRHINTHISIFGMTGEGKTHFASNLIRQAMNKGVKCLLFDPKGEYHALVSSFDENNDHITYFLPGDSKKPLTLNIFEIPKDENGHPIIKPEEHLSFLIPAIESMIERQDDFLSPQMRQLLYKAIEWTIKNDGNMATFLEILEDPHLLGLKGSYIENTGLALINRFSKFTFGTGKAIFQESNSNISPKLLLERNVIIDLSLLEAREDLQFRSLLINYIIHLIFHYLRRTRAPRRSNDKPTNIILIDEIQKMLPSMGASHFSVAGQSPWTLRAYGVSMIFVGTDPFVEKPILTNTGLSVAFFSKAPPKHMAMLLGLTMTDYEKLKSLYKLADSKYKALVSYRGKVFLLDIPKSFDGMGRDEK